ncbi:hypothetical protein B0H14DRAFT_3154232 [Mycena olivaceomarginata]|nr:hypothetical protein B0H14DRAFT_3154232 [Mycena olivaceomarginata]
MPFPRFIMGGYVLAKPSGALAIFFCFSNSKMKGKGELQVFMNLRNSIARSVGGNHRPHRPDLEQTDSPGAISFILWEQEQMSIFNRYLRFIHFKHIPQAMPARPFPANSNSAKRRKLIGLATRLTLARECCAPGNPDRTFSTRRTCNESEFSGF